jgi:hypothetical protein
MPDAALHFAETAARILVKSNRHPFAHNNQIYLAIVIKIAPKGIGYHARHGLIGA